MSASSEYVEKYAEFAIEQQCKYGIPASVTLAQGILESANGKSQLSRECNNHFGIKANRSWIDSGGQYGLYTDDKPNEKFCKYASVGNSYEHHSKILRNSSRYSACFLLEPTDYKGWCRGLEKGGYATAGTYANSLITVIERMDLAKYDRIALERGPLAATEAPVINTGASASAGQSNHYSFPVKRDEFLFVTSPFGMRNDPIYPGTRRMHNGIDISCKGDNLLATEDNGKVVNVNHNVNTGGGKSVTVEYTRPDNTKTQVTYMHLSEIAVKEGDAVMAGTKLGVSGNTGTRTTGEHLHFAVKQVSADGTARQIDPAAYLAEIAQKGNIQLTAMHNGQSLLAKYADQTLPNGEENPLAINPDMSPDDWMKKLLSSEDSGVNVSADPIMDLVVTMFTSLMALAAQIDGKSKQEQLQMASDIAQTGTIDLRTLLPNLKECTLRMQDGANPVLTVNNGSVSFSHELTNAEMQRLSAALSEKSESKVAAIINNIVTQQQMSQSFDRQVSNDQSQSMGIK